MDAIRAFFPSAFIGLAKVIALQRFSCCHLRPLFFAPTSI